MALTTVRGYRVIFVPGGDPSIELLDGKKVVGTATFSDAPAQPRIERDPETQHVDVRFDRGQYGEVLTLLRHANQLFVDDVAGHVTVSKDR